MVYYCSAGRIVGVIKMGNLWLLPRNSEKPQDRRYKKIKKFETHSHIGSLMGKEVIN